jgi:hypothetical protein
MLGRCELSAWDFGAVSIARGSNQGIECQVFQRATLGTGTRPGSLAGLRAPALPLRFGTVRDRETIDSELRLIAALPGRPLIWARRSRASTWPMNSSGGSSLARLARQNITTCECAYGLTWQLSPSGVLKVEK